MRYRLSLVCALALSWTAPAPQAATHPSFSVAVAGRGPAIVLIPGLMTPGAVWQSTVERYQDRYTLHTVTLAGFGGPAPVGAPFLPRVRDELIQYLRTNRIEKPVIVGHSLGGFLAYWIAATAPDLIGGVVAVDGVPFLPALGNPAATAAAMAPQARQIEALYASFTGEQLVAQSRMALGAMITKPADVEHALTWVTKVDPRTTGLAVAEMMTTDLRADVARITAPVLLLGATGGAPEARRPALEQGYAAQLARLPGARVKIASTARHFIMLDDPAFLYSALDAFLAER